MNSFTRRQLIRWRLLRRKTFDLPMIFIAFSGAFLFLLLPHNISEVKNISPLPAPQVKYAGNINNKISFAGNPTIFALPSIYGFSATNEVLHMPDISEYWYTLSPHYLPDSDYFVNCDIDNLLKIKGLSAPTIFPNIVDVDSTPVLGALIKTNRVLTVEYKGGLSKCGFRVKNEFTNELLGENQSWMAKIFVQIGKNGYPEQLFLEKSSKIPKIDAKILKILHYSKIKKPGMDCEGTVVVNFGL